MWGIIRKRAAENRPLWPNAVLLQLRRNQNYYYYSVNALRCEFYVNFSINSNKFMNKLLTDCNSSVCALKTCRENTKNKLAYPAVDCPSVRCFDSTEGIEIWRHSELNRMRQFPRMPCIPSS